MSERHANDEKPKTGEPAPAAKPADGGVELTDEQLDKVAGGMASDVVKKAHDTSAHAARNFG